MNQDIEFPAPEPVQRVRQAVKEADALWFFTPEYNHSYPASIKNFLDWLSRPLVGRDRSTAVSRGKKALVSGVAGSSTATKAREKMAEFLTVIGMDVRGGSGEGYALGKESFVSGKLLLTQEDVARLERQANDLVRFLQNA